MHITNFKHGDAKASHLPHWASTESTYKLDDKVQHDIFCSGCGDHLAIQQPRVTLEKYCSGSGKAITPHDLHFKCLECQQVYLHTFHFKDTAICKQCAYASGMAKVLEWEQHKDDYDAQGKTQLSLAIEGRDVKEVRRLLIKGVDPNKGCQHDSLLTPLRIAIRHDDITITTLLLQHGALFETEVYTHLLNDAIQLKSVKMVQFLLKSGATMSASWLTEVMPMLSVKELSSVFSCIGHRPLSFEDYVTVVKQHDIDKLKLLLQFDQQMPLNQIISSTGQSLLHIHAEHPQQDKMTAYLLHAGIASNHQDHMGDTPLHVAAEHGDLGKIKRLIQAGAKLNAKNTLGVTALEKATSQNKCKVMDLLIQLGAKVQARNHHGWSALDIAVQQNHSDAVAILLDAGINPNRENQGWTPLAKAVADKQARLVSQLIAAGADPNHACVLLHINRDPKEDVFFVGQ